MKIITSVGYYGTGSSAVTDYLREFKSCFLAGNGYEIRFVQDPNGLSDLAYNVVENNNRHNTSDAIKKFIKYMCFLNGGWYTKRYRKCFGDNFLPLTLEYINSITQLKTKTWWHYDQIEKGKAFYFFDILYGKIARMLNDDRWTSLLKNKEDAYYTAIESEEFYEKTREYTDKLFELANPNGVENLVVEQLVAPSNVSRYSKFFNNIKVIVVERDPRDIYLTAKNNKRGMIPVRDVEEFCKWYRITRKHRDYEIYDNNVLFMYFEDFVYHYDKTAEVVKNFLNIKEEDHVLKKSYFDPARSIKGTRKFIDDNEYREDIRYIEKNLAKYLYDDYES